jgi:hypothetical protein
MNWVASVVFGCGAGLFTSLAVILWRLDVAIAAFACAGWAYAFVCRESYRFARELIRERAT